MSKRIWALVCLLALFVGVFAFGATASTGGDGKYDVGYAKADVNPWVQSEYTGGIGIPAQYTDADGNLVDYTDAATNIIDTTVNDPTNNYVGVKTPLVRVKLSGYGSVTTRLAETVSDDNGDGKVTVNGDGLQVTVTSVTDDWGKTVMYITIDSLGGYWNFTRDVRNAIVKELGSDVIGPNDIMVSGSHSHEAPDLTDCANAATGTALRAYYDYYVARTVQAAADAYNTASPADMSKGSIEAGDHFGKPLNFVRHYNITQKTGIIIKETHTWVGGDNFGGSFSEDNSDGFFDTSSTTLSHVSEANQTMNILQFTRNNGEKPIVLIQWQAHASIMGQATRTNISSDYINALRYRLENNKTQFGGNTDYCVGFWQGTGGNMNNTSRISSEYTYTPSNAVGGKGWVATDPSTVGLTAIIAGGTDTTSTRNRTYRNALYGYILGTVALDCLKNDNMTGTLDMGKIHTIQSIYKGQRQQDSEGLRAAAVAWRTDYDAGETITYPYPYTYNGTVYALNSFYHAYNVEQRAKDTTDDTSLELNAIVMGENVALVTAPLELFDRYDINGSVADADNDWLNLGKDDQGNAESFGDPFILSKSNSRAGYIPNALAYDYYTDQTGTVAEGTKMGSYEANIAVHARGTGEAIVAHFDEMLDLAANGYVEADCPKCGTVEWTPLLSEGWASTTLTNGHYYLVEDAQRTVGAASQKSVGEGQTLCVNLNGHVAEAEGRNFNIANGGTVNLINDTSFPNAGTGGVMRSYTGSNNAGGGVVTMAAGSTFNLYGGTMEFVAEDTTETGHYGTGIGGIFSLTGTLNVYGGTIKGAELVDSSFGFGYDGSGGAVYMYGGGKLNVYGGEITSGTLPTANDLPTAGGALKACGPCVFASASTCRIKLSGSADVEDIYILSNNGSLLTVDGEYTGTTGITMGCSVSEGMDIGNITNNATFPNLTCVSPATHHLRASGSNLILTSFDESVVAVTGSTGYTTLQAAIDGYTGTQTNYAIKLMADIEEDIVMNAGRTAVVNLNGFNIKSATVTSGKLLCMDNATDDFDVYDGIYGKILAGSGNILGYNMDGSRNSNSYMMIDEDGALSFHAVNLRMSAMTLRPATDGVSAPSVYYQSNFKADHMAAAKIKSYGIAMSTIERPTTSNLESVCKKSTFTVDKYPFKPGATGNAANGTLLKGVMKPTNAALVNRRNANVPVYGAAYVLTDEGYIWGPAQDRTLAQQAEAIDKDWSSLTDTEKSGMVKMYDTYKSIVSKWTMPNLSTAMGATQDGALKVLVIGNSHGLDATNLLYEVFEDQGYDEQKLVLGALYYSGCNMTQHATFMTNEQAKYDYYENDGSNADGSWNVQENVVADVALNAHQWDIVILQQMNHRAGVDSTAAYCYNADDFKTVINYVREHQNGIPKFGWHMVWTNPDQDEYWDPSSSLSHPTKTDTNWKDTNDQLYPGADGTYDQALMYQGVVACTQKYIEGDKTFLGEDVFDFVIPACTAVEYAQDVLGLSQAQIYRDYTHMNDYGRLIAAYTWYAKIMELDQIPAVGIDAIPAVLHHSKSEYPSADSGYAVTDDMKKLIRNAVNYALDNPYELPSEEDNTVSILGIGNSYTIDSMHLLGEVYKAENLGKDVKLGIAYKSGESLTGHVTNINANSAAYTYYELNSDGTWSTTSNMTLQQIIKAQKWEMVSMQQSSGSSGRPETYNADIQTIQTYVEEQLGYVPTYLWNMTWAYPEADIEDNYTLDTAPNAYSFKTYYGSSQATMYKAITDTVQAKILPDATFEYLMPVGTAIQNANATLDDPDLYRDYTHLNDLSRVIAAYVWYCELELVTLDEIQLTKIPAALTKSYVTAGGSGDMTLTDTQIQLIASCVKAAMKDNFTTTDTSVYAE